MENAPVIILAAYFSAAIFALAVAMAIAAIILLRRGKTPSEETMRVLGRVCSILSMLCFTPAVLALGYILYLRFT